MTRHTLRIDALRRFEHDATIRALLEDATTFELSTLELLSHIECGRLVVAQGLNTESYEVVSASIGFAELAADGKYRQTYQRQEDGSFLIIDAGLPGPFRPLTEEELQWLS